MEDKKQEAIDKIKQLKTDGEHHYFNMFQDGGALVYYFNGLYLLYEIPLYGGKERYSGTYFDWNLKAMVDEAFSWT